MTTEEELKEDFFDWMVTNFSTKYYRSEEVQIGGHCSPAKVAPVRLRKPFPTSPAFTTEFGNMRAEWQLRLTSTCDDRPEVYPERWSFSLDLISTEFNGQEDDNDKKTHPPPPLAAKKRKIINSEITTVGVSVAFLTSSGNQTYYSTEDKTLKFGPNCVTKELGWPTNCQEREDSDSYGCDCDDCEGPTDGAEYIHRNRKKWVSRTDDTLHVRLIIRHIGSKPSPPDQCDQDKLTLNLKSDMAKLWESGYGADVIVRCGDGPESVSFTAHQVILSMRNPVFKAMLESAMIEGKSKIIKIKGFEEETVKRLLEFFYTAKIEVCKLDLDMIFGLFRAADMYMVEDLKEYCFKHLLTQLNDDTCGNLAVTAYLHGVEPWRKKLITDYVDKHWPVLKTKEEFQELFMKYPKAFWGDLPKKPDEKSKPVNKRYGRAEPMYSQ